MDVTNIEIVEGTIQDLKNVYQRFTADFASEELKGYEHLKLLMSKRRYKLLLAKDPILHEVVGYAFIYEFDRLQGIWLDYMAIDNQYRGSGYGALLFKKLTKWKQNGFSGGIFIEVEMPEEKEGFTRENQLRRIRFYERLGTKRLPIPYQLPTNDGGLPMYLYFWPSPDVEKLPREQLQEAISEVFNTIHSDVKHKDEILMEFNTLIDDDFDI
ncbi:GNAT family N-acetyltransferase [Neobacillus sp. YX16]|uniref:GNAT family N-acetyltransferase n=1 Tax=Neobacillus sp. YX16 TaxID=3047874 RepID=UPI0024C2565B|nr:GNAT family N-acetyltransferase [Neobacillus sp. YX16]WHZ02574.1 GNAT family N-acetyltransferase [Neobacillus sp. YX16]